MTAGPSWVQGAEGSGFGLQHLPFGVDAAAGPVVAVGPAALPLRPLAATGRLGDADAAWFDTPTLDAFLAAGPGAWATVRGALQRLLGVGAHLPERRAVEPLLVPRDGVRLLLPVTVGDYVDFYASIHHATNLGRILRPGTEPLLPNWRHLPVGYHGRAGTVVVSGTPVRRPNGLRRQADGPPSFGPSRELDLELEVATVVGVGSELGTPVPIGRAAAHLFGVALLNDWSARDIQAFEYQPLGPFLGKSFATSLAGWITPLAALAPYRRPGPAQDPRPEPHLCTADPWALDLRLEASLQSATMRATGVPPARISASGFADLYWTIAQQFAHLTANGASVRPGDLFGSGTVSGPTPGSEGSLIELTRRGERPLRLPDGGDRGFLADGDVVVLTARAGDGPDHLQLGEVRGEVLPAWPVDAATCEER
jgi:fumarylacetoacetase